MQILLGLFNDWVEPDHAQYFLACALGMMRYDPDFAAFRRVSHVFQVKNPVGTMLYRMLEQMVEAGILQENEKSQYRVNPSFAPFWEETYDGAQLKTRRIA